MAPRPDPDQGVRQSRSKFTIGTGRSIINNFAPIWRIPEALHPQARARAFAEPATFRSPSGSPRDSFDFIRLPLACTSIERRRDRIRKSASDSLVDAEFAIPLTSRRPKTPLGILGIGAERHTPTVNVQVRDSSIRSCLCVAGQRNVVSFNSRIEKIDTHELEQTQIR